MRRTQLYLDDDLWGVMHERARAEGTTVSDLVRLAVRERYVGSLEERRKAMLAFVGIRNNAPEPEPTDAYIRRLRSGSRRRAALGTS
jgi:hypothetical protein